MKYSFLLIFYFLALPFSNAQRIEKAIVYFEFNRYDLDRLSKSKIDSFLIHGDILKISIEGHCDSVGSNPYNDVLSIRRADAVKRYFIEKTIGEKKIITAGRGKREPINKNLTEQDRALNRRAEITLFLKTEPAASLEKTATVSDNTMPVTDSTAIKLENAEVGSSIRLENLNFVGGRHVLLPKSEPTLTMLLNTMKTNPTLEIQIQGHVCCIGEDEDGLDFDTKTYNLSVNRAKMIYDFLISNGIDEKRLSYRGFGARYKLVEELTEEDRSTNRRVEIRIVKK
jgi:outer membrane protein OmpA-like peptidoglycan-associated protein